MIKVEKNKDLEKFNFYTLKVKAKYFIEMKNKEDCLEIFEWIKNHKIKKYFILGKGSNIIFKNKFFDGLIIKISNNFLKWESKERKTIKRVEVGAGKVLDVFLAECQKKNVFDIQSLSSIPGSVGAGVFGNVGAFGTEVKKFVFGVWAFDNKKKEFVFFENKKCGFSYRSSFLKKNKKRFLIYSVVFDFSEKFKKEMKAFYKKEDYFSLQHFTKKYNIKSLKKKNLRKEIKKIRRQVYPNIKKYPNVGSTFKNTEVIKTQLKKILKDYPDIPNWEQKNGNIKVSTAYIFDKVLNLNGKTFGNIEVDKKRPLFFINRGVITGQEFFVFCQKVKNMTQKKWGIKIKEEVFFID